MIIKINKKNFPMNFSTYILHSNTFKFDCTAFDDDNNQTTDDFEFTLHFLHQQNMYTKPDHYCFK